MSKLKSIRESRNLTQEELSEKSGISVRTIQRIESGKEPKGYTLRVLAEALGIKEELLKNRINVEPEGVIHKENEPLLINYTKIKLVNLSSLPFVVVPFLNILIPLVLVRLMKLKYPITKQIISLQIMWTIIAPILFMLAIFFKPGKNITLLIMILLVISNVFIILRNAFEIDKYKKLYYSLSFSMI